MFKETQYKSWFQLNRPRERAFKQFKCPRPQCVNMVNMQLLQLKIMKWLVTIWKAVIHFPARTLKVEVFYFMTLITNTIKISMQFRRRMHDQTWLIGQNLWQCHSVCQKSHTEWRGMKLGPPRERPAINRLRKCMTSSKTGIFVWHRN